ncbi:MAG: menaquinone biosynthesis decarboxylase [Armatimonadetes bacterium]|nr:menaquinone biosynthesis decarboxylase [Armatimonadota bacterium]
MNLLEKNGELKRVKALVSTDLEITEIADRMVKNNRPAIIFENIKESKIPLAINLFASFKRMNLALGVKNIEEIALRIEKALKIPALINFWDKIKMLPQILEFSKYLPLKTKKAPCQEIIINEPDLEILPILKCWPEDGGKFITLPLVFTKDPDTHQRNAGMYRMQVFNKKTTGMHWHTHKDGAVHYKKYQEKNLDMPVSVALGCDPATIYAATAPLPYGIDELLFAGFLKQEPVEVVKCITNDLEVPANAEIILEGYVDLKEKKLEGPFGDHTGYYSLADYYPVFHIKCITYRKNPIYPATIVGKPPMEDCFFGKATERIFLPLMKLLIPEIVDLNLPIEGVFHNCALVSIKKTYPGQAKKVMHAMWGLGQMMFTKIIIVFDKDTDIQNLSESSWKLYNNIDPKRDLVIVDGPVDILNHASPSLGYGSKLGIDATCKFKEEGMPREWPSEIIMRKKKKKLVNQKWKDYAL